MTSAASAAIYSVLAWVAFGRMGVGRAACPLSSRTFIFCFAFFSWRRFSNSLITA